MVSLDIVNVLVSDISLATPLVLGCPERFDILVHPLGYCTLVVPVHVAIHPKRVLCFMQCISLAPEVLELPPALQKWYDECGVKMGILN